MKVIVVADHEGANAILSVCVVARFVFFKENEGNNIPSKQYCRCNLHPVVNTVVVKHDWVF
jgi:hypothetical protein